MAKQRHISQGDHAYTDESMTYSDLPLFSQPIVTANRLSGAAVQQAELARVTGKTSEAIEQFFDCHQVGETFHAGDLHKFVSARAPVAPASADRVMRAMRKAGQVNYEVVDRSQSLYRKCLPCQTQN